MARPNKTLLQNSFSIVSDIRFLQILGQTIFLILVVFALSALLRSITGALASKGLTPNFAFLQNRAGFEIAGAAGYSPDDSYWAAYNVGLRNTLTVVSAGLIGATVLGILGGVSLLSGNWLIRNISRFIIEILRNTPLLVQIFVWYFVVVLALPVLQQAIQIPQAGLVALPMRYALYGLVALGVWRYMRNLRADQLERRAFLIPALVVAVVVIEIGFLFFYRTSGRNLYGTGLGLDAGAPQIIYVVVTLLFGIVIYVASRRIRMETTAVVTGLLIGMILFFFGVVMDSALIVEVQPLIYLSNRGLVYPEFHATARFAEWFLFVVLGITVAVLLYAFLGRVTEQTGKPYPRIRYGLASILLFSVIGWFVVGTEPIPATVPVTRDGTVTVVPLEQARTEGLLTPEDELQYTEQPLIVKLPERAGLRFSSGTTLDQRYIALLLALMIYTAAFIAEIVRAGILAVPHGQIEAARALGLSGSQVLTMVVLPQALRVIIPPLGNQYLNLAKNSSLALAIAYSDIYAVMSTVINQSGQAVTGIILIMLSYLILSLLIAGVMNWVNGRFQLVTR